MLIALGVTGGIGAYKAVEVARGLQRRGHDVVAVMTHAATRFVGPVTFEAITRRRVIVDQFDAGMNADIEHIALASTIDLLLIAPATANVIGKMANGIADDFLSTLYIATRAPVLVAPAMNTQMFAHEAVRRNLDTLAAADAVLRPPSALRGLRMLISAGPTYEDFDPVRYIGNRSSGRMGYALADEAAQRGAEVTLVTGPTTIDLPEVREILRVRTAAEMHDAIVARAGNMDVVVMAAAVADYAPVQRAGQKVQKGGDEMTIVLRKTPDILGELGLRRLSSGRGPLLVGFAAETENVVARAVEKRAKKHADLIVANDVSRSDAGFDVETNAVTIVSAEGAETLPLQPKARVAAEILDRVERLLVERTASAAKT